MDRNRTGRWALALLGVLTLGGALLRAWQIGDKSLWIDEAFSVWIARQPLAEGVSWLARIDQHPPLYYALLHLWLRLGDGPAAVRLLSALVSALNVPVLYGLGARLAGRKVGLLAAAVLALSPFHVYLAQEARMYALLSLTVSLSLWALARLLSDTRTMGLPGEQLRAAYRQWRAGGRWPRPSEVATDLAWLGYALATGAALWTHNTAVLYWVAANAIVLGLWLTGRRRQTGVGALTAPPLGNWALAQGAALLLWAPWLPGFVCQSAAVCVLAGADRVDARDLGRVWGAARPGPAGAAAASGAAVVPGRRLYRAGRWGVADQPGPADLLRSDADLGDGPALPAAGRRHRGAALPLLYLGGDGDAGDAQPAVGARLL